MSMTSLEPTPSTTCDPKCYMERQVYRKEMLRSGKSLLASIGLEQVSLRTAGSRYWRAFNKAVKASVKASGKDWEPGPCPWCNDGKPREDETTTNSENEMFASKFFDFSTNKMDPGGLFHAKTEASSVNVSQPLNFDHIFKIEPPKSNPNLINPNLLPPYFPTGMNPFSTDVRGQLNGMYPSWPSASQMSSMLGGYGGGQNMKYKSEADMIQQRMAQWQHLMSMHFNMINMGQNKPPVSLPDPISANHLSVPSFHPPRSRSPVVSSKSKSPITTITIDDDDMPLDLSMGSKRRSENSSFTKLSELNTQDPDGDEMKAFSPASMASDITQKVFSMNKKNYSQADLDAAVMDIRLGKLGTRRASVVYGIPRSTLRNKIYKLEAAEDNNTVEGAKKRKLNPPVGRKKEKDLSKPLFPSNLGSIDTSGLAGFPQIGTPTTESITPLASTPPAMSPFLMSNSNMVPSLNSLTNLLKRYVENSENNTGLGMPNGVLPDQNSSDEMEIKKARPKRGQYRKYDKTALDKAVASVRKGEMSVHRAGSFYGVPHSTLEYKVKERNLLRKKKLGENGEVSSDQQASDMPSEANNTQDSSSNSHSNSVEPSESRVESVVSNSNTSTSDS